MENISFPKVWNLDKIFKGGGKSSQFLQHIERLEELISELEDNVESITSSIATNEISNVVHILEDIGNIRLNISEANSFITCLIAQKPKDQDAVSLRGNVAQIDSRFEKVISEVKKVLSNIEEDVWRDILEIKGLENHQFILNEEN